MRMVMKVESVSIAVNGQQVVEIQPATCVVYTPPPRQKFPLPTGFEYISVDLKTTSKLIRQELKKEYRLTKFSIRSEVMSGGTSVIRVRWFNDKHSPTMDEVDTLLDKYSGAVLDDSGDVMDSVAVQIEHRWYHFEVTYISCQRDTQVVEGIAH